MQNTSCEMLCWMNHKLESRFPGKISMTSDIYQMTPQMIPPYGRKWRRTKESLDESERGEWKNWLKTHIQKTNNGIQSHHFMTNRWGNNGNTDCIFLGSKVTADGDCSHEIKRRLLLGRKAMTNLDNILKSRGITNKGTYSQTYGFSSSHVWMWELGHKESWVPKNWCFWTGFGEDSCESLGQQGHQFSQPKRNLPL